MRQWKTTLLSDGIVDDRSREDILNKMKELAASYTPEWQFDTENPDIGSCIALLYADEMQELIRRFNTIPERNCVEMVNFLNIFLKAAYPAHGIVLMDIIQNTVPGVKLRKGVKLLASDDGEQNVTFETANSLYLTNAKLKTLFMTSGFTGNVYPVKGDFPPLQYIDAASIIRPSDEDEENEQELLPQMSAPEERSPEEMAAGETELLMEEIEDLSFHTPFALFDFDRIDYGLHGTLLFHSHIFDVSGNDILMELRGGKGIIDGIIDGTYRFSYLTGAGFCAITDVTRVSEERLVFRKEEECVKVSKNGEAYSVILIEPTEPVTKNVVVSGIGFSSTGKPSPLQNVWDGNSELNPNEFRPFGEIMSTYAELYMEHEEYFTKPGAKITMEFFLDFDSKLVAIPKAQEDEQLKIIKKKPKRDIYGAPAEVFADAIVLEYYNGIGWKRLKTTAPVTQMFQNNTAGNCKIEFICPADWKKMEEGHSEAHWVRIRLLQADNCYYQPSLHHFPVIKNMTVSYTYEDHLDGPQKVICFQGRRQKDMTLALARDPYVPLFFRSPYNSTSLYLGFDKKFMDGPISIMIDVDEMEGYSGRNIKYYYSSRNGFARLKLIDNTDGLEHTGTIVFIPPTDMTKISLEGQERYWIRITDEKAEEDKNSTPRQIVKNIQVNAVEVNNIETLSPQDYYIDMFGPNMTFALNADKILDADVWVNEIDHFTDSEMKAMLIEKPATTRAEYSMEGKIDEFYIKWQETENFDQSEPTDRHYLIDRQNNTISFGDGVHVMIPKNTDGVAFKTLIRCCDGKLANVEAGAINTSMSNLMFVNQVFNPMPTFGGMDMETLDEALRRGALLLGTKNRLISTMDYEREVLNFSSNIIQAKAVVDVRKDGSKVPGAITMVLLMDDFKDGPNSFLKMKNRVKEHLLTKCELSVDERYFDIVQPLYVRISAELWVRLIESDDSFEVQQHLMKVLSSYLDPVANPFWDIGRMVSESQIGMQLNLEKGSAMIERVMLSAKYEDADGYHEADLGALKGNPYVLVMSGGHKIHFL